VVGARGSNLISFSWCWRGARGVFFTRGVRGFGASVAKGHLVAVYC